MKKKILVASLLSLVLVTTVSSQTTETWFKITNRILGRSNDSLREETFRQYPRFAGRMIWSGLSREDLNNRLDAAFMELCQETSQCEEIMQKYQLRIER